MLVVVFFNIIIHIIECNEKMKQNVIHFCIFPYGIQIPLHRPGTDCNLWTMNDRVVTLGKRESHSSPLSSTFALLAVWLY